MKLKQSEYTGITSEKYDLDQCLLSIVNFKTSAPEDWHYHENRHLSLVLQGGSRESRKNGDFQLTAGKIILYNEGEIHCNKYTAFPSKHLILEFKNDFFNKRALDSKKFTKTNVQNIDITIALLNIYNELTLADLYSSNAINFSLNQLLESDEKSSYIPIWVKQMKEIIEDRWDEFIPLNELAVIFNVHPVTISKYFKKYYNCTLGDYMRKIKLEKALFLLNNTNKSIIEISDICGFSDQSHMIKIFKTYIGFLPNRFRSL